MRRTSRACVFAVVLALAITTTAAPARAAVDWTSLIVNVVTKLFSGGGSNDAALQAAVRQIIDAVNGSKADIIAHTDVLASAEVRACARQHAIEFTDIDNMNPTTLQIWAQNATGCATLASAYLSAVTAPQAVHDIGAALGPIFTIAAAARARAGLVNGTDLLVRDEISSYQKVVVKLTPSDCTKYRAKEPGFPVEKWWECTAFNGDVGQSDWVTGSNLEPDRTQAENRATRNTSRPLAQDAVPRLVAILP